MKIVVVGDTDTAVGLKLAGVSDAYIVNDKQEAESTIKKLSQTEDIGLIIITEKIANQVRDVIRRILEQDLPILVEIPDKYGPVSGETDIIRDLIRKAVGIDLKR